MKYSFPLSQCKLNLEILVTFISLQQQNYVRQALNCAQLAQMLKLL